MISPIIITLVQYLIFFPKGKNIGAKTITTMAKRIGYGFIFIAMGL